jgi:hypothetical protein
MRTQITALLLLSAFLVGCQSGPSAMSRRDLPDGHEPSVLKPAPEEVPAAVRAIEVAIDRKSALIADEIEIYVSRNYEWDVALTGDVVTPQTPIGEEHQSTATGNARATFRNLEIRAWKRIVFRKSGFQKNGDDVVPFIKITAKGQAALAMESGRNGKLDVKRADMIAINNADISYVNPALAGDSSDRGDVPAGMHR